MTSATGQRAQRRTFDHLGAPYYSTEEYAAITVGFVRAALTQGNPVMVAVPGQNVEVVRQGLDSDATSVLFADMAVAGRNPGRIIPGVLINFSDRHGGRRVSIIGEPTWPDRSPIEYPACVTHEALINAAFAGRDAEILCPYDANKLTPAAVADANGTHPILCDARRRWRNASFEDPDTTVARFNESLTAPPGADQMTIGDVSTLASVREFVAHRARAAGLAPDRVQSMVVAVNELATNTTRHTEGPGQLTVWTEDRMLVCQVSDCGHLSDPLAGRIPPRDGQDGGYGLVIINQLVDLVRVHTSPGRTTIRLYSRI